MPAGGFYTTGIIRKCNFKFFNFIGAGNWFRGNKTDCQRRIEIWSSWN